MMLVASPTRLSRSRPGRRASSAKGAFHELGVETIRFGTPVLA